MGGAIPKPLRRSRPTPAPTPTPTPTPVISPTAPEVSQATATSMDGYDSRKTKAKGRSSTIMIQLFVQLAPQDFYKYSLRKGN